jgi:hypothetical protein
MYKLLMSWDIKPLQDQDYFEFMVREFAPRITSMGLTPTEAWFAVYGKGPQIIVEGVMDDLEGMRNLLESDDWQSLHRSLLEYVDHYQQKVVAGRSDLQL